MTPSTVQWGKISMTHPRRSYIVHLQMYPRTCFFRCKLINKKHRGEWVLILRRSCFSSFPLPTPYDPKVLVVVVALRLVLATGKRTAERINRPIDRNCSHTPSGVCSQSKKTTGTCLSRKKSNVTL